MNDIEKPDILAVFEFVGYQVPSPQREGWCKVRCPVHEDRTPSASISVELGRWKCFSCSLNEDGLDVLMREKGLTFIQALELAKDLSGGTAVAPKRGRKTVERRSLWED